MIFMIVLASIMYVRTLIRHGKYLLPNGCLLLCGEGVGHVMSPLTTSQRISQRGKNTVGKSI